MSELKAMTVLNVLQMGCYDNVLVYFKSEADKAIVDLEESHKMEVEQLLMEIEELKKERRWRKCSDEMPSADEGYFIVLWEDKFPDIGYIGAEDDVIETIRDRGEGHSVEWWMPIPSAPKEAK